MPREPSAAARQARGPSAAPRQTRELSAAARVHSSDWGRGGTQIFKIEKNISKRILPKNLKLIKKIILYQKLKGSTPITS